MHNFLISNGDTDSLTFYKPDQGYITPDERKKLLSELNSLFPEGLVWEDDGFYKTMIVFKAKNYILQTEDGQIKIKGSSLKSSNKEKALKDLNDELIKAMIEGTTNYTEIYHKYVKEALEVKDIKRWASKKTISERTLNSERTNESRIRDAIENSEYVEGDKVYMFFKTEKELELIENFNGEYCKTKLLDKIFNSIKLFETVLPFKENFINYKLKRNQLALKDLIDEDKFIWVISDKEKIALL